MKSIKETPSQEVLKELFDYNPETGELFYRKTVGRRAKEGSRAGFVTKKGYIRVTVQKERFMAHRVIWKWMTGEDPQEGLVIDHINELPHDNSWGNLRLLTNEENIGRTPKPTGRSGHQYIYWCHNRWQVLWKEEVTLTAGDTSVTTQKRRQKSFRDLDQAVAFQRGLKGSEG